MKWAPINTVKSKLVFIVFFLTKVAQVCNWGNTTFMVFKMILNKIVGLRCCLSVCLFCFAGLLSLNAQFENTLNTV